MVSEINEAGYQEIRDFIQSNWDYIELYDDTDSAIGRWEVGGSKASWTHSAGDQTLEMTLIVTGADLGVGNTVSGSRIFSVATGGDILHQEPFANAFTVSQDNDELTVKHQIQVPQV